MKIKTLLFFCLQIMECDSVGQETWKYAVVTSCHVLVNCVLSVRCQRLRECLLN